MKTNAPSMKTTPELSIEQIRSSAEHALALMNKYNIAPIPKNFTIWYAYAQGKNKDLVSEIDRVVNNSLEFSESTASYIYNKFIDIDETRKVVDEAAINSEKTLVEVLKAIHDFSDETKTYSKNVDEYLGSITQRLDDDNIKTVVKNLVAATINMKESSKKLGSKLEESTAEINALKKDLEKVTTESQRDFLTGAFNRKTFEKYADEQIAAAKEADTELCLLMIDIDHFKSFNDRYGHLLGDEVLKIVAKTLINTLKGQDMVARFGGEEFVVILPSTKIEGAMIVAESIRASIATKELKRKDTGETFGTITVSMGAARFRPDSDTLPLLIKRADDALYHSKKNGRNRVTRESAE